MELNSEKVNEETQAVNQTDEDSINDNIETVGHFDVDEVQEKLNEELGLNSLSQETENQAIQEDNISDISFEQTDTEYENDSAELEENIQSDEQDENKPSEEFLNEAFSNVDKILTEAISAIPVVTKSVPLLDEAAKKYVIYIDSDNISYMENLSVNDRRRVINDVLRESYHLSSKEKETKRRNKYISHLLLAIITFIICFPLFFIAVNKAAKISIINYGVAKENVSRLYKPQGKIQPKN